MLDTLRDVETPEGVALQLRCAGVVPRALAWLLDLMVRGAVIVALSTVMGLLGGMANMKDARNMEMGVAIGIGVGVLCFIGVVAWNCVLLHRRGQTIAKKLLGIRVVRKDGSRCGLTRIFFARYLPVTVLGLIPFVGGLVSLVDALLIFRDDRRCLHDEIADTIVVRA